ncbi:helix-turn-helix domain-containing protein [Paenibacillus dendritiformis]|uniref:helix-turn-helix domain-containing protein n=1 Tax=Paenibacillus dendritiformis TaxID=130049 RepID=UPI00248C57FE|nr:helix-turn-helix domain-containing protein [Paenibacillus dendritiformis]WGU92238.1 helix-turn-helix domain-containing protein [Paenibacillus dendritiformis]
MRKLLITNRHGWNVYSLNRLTSTIQDPKKRIKVEAVRLVMSGHTAKDVAKQLGIHRQTVSNYVKIFNDGGLEQLLTNVPSPGKPRILTPEQEEELIGIISSRKPSSGTAAGWSMRDIQDLLEKHFQVHMTRTGVRDMLRRLGLKYTSSGYVLYRTE